MGIFVRIYHYLFGFFTVNVREEQRASLVSLFLKERIAAYSTKDGSFLIGAEFQKRVETLLSKGGLEAKISARKGIPALLRLYRARVGLFVGAFAVCLLLTLASRVVWHVEVSGNESISNAEIIEDLREIGFGAGSNIRKTDFVDLSASLRLKHSEIAHADIYCVGTVAHVRIVEAKLPQRDEASNLPAHLIASRDAIVESFDVKHGSVVAECGQLVKKGDVLVSGIITGAHGDVLLHADGRVFGRVSDEIVIEIPYKQAKEVVKGYKKGKKTLFFFGKAINIRKNAGNLPTTYGTIVEREEWTLPGGHPLPIFSLEEKIVLLETEELTLSYKEALSLAYARLGTEIVAKTKDGYLISKSVSATSTEDVCVLKCTVSYVTSISEDKPIELLE